nr:immunoglobulin heavy chain junction region [Macaca mulatta]MOW76906.1 immunoglobulin heavy chain junction region [Macaca mulatta]MOW79588.1 immunoglobulin heavy chain junction region [Macaca mulatta]MOW81133.1 immunoglobulin heavy chain junction region [Macaca mulatta]
CARHLVYNWRDYLDYW